MATSVVTTFHGYAAGETFTPAELRSGMTSRAAIMGDSTALKGRPGILPGAGTPLLVSQASTPNMTVLVKAGTVIQQTGDSPGGVYSHTLAADTNLDIGAAPGSNSRYDVVVAKIFDNGSAPTWTIEVLPGTAAASPALPTALTSPAANTYYFPLARVTVATGTVAITNAMIAFPAAAGGLPTFSQNTVSPGGLVPVANLTAAAGLPLYTPFYSVADRSTGKLLPGGASLDGHQHRYIHKFGGASTNANGDATLTFGLFFAGTFAASPFPNGCFGLAITDCSSPGAVDVPLVIKPFGTGGPPTASSVVCRVYFGNHTKYTSAGFDAYGIAWGW
jgi:hypothetical protein